VDYVKPRAEDAPPATPQEQQLIFERAVAELRTLLNSHDAGFAQTGENDEIFDIGSMKTGKSRFRLSLDHDAIARRMRLPKSVVPFALLRFVDMEATYTFGYRRKSNE
jgi:hypothetical protein